MSTSGRPHVEQVDARTALRRAEHEARLAVPRCADGPRHRPARRRRGRCASGTARRASRPRTPAARRGPGRPAARDHDRARSRRAAAEAPDLGRGGAERPTLPAGRAPSATIWYVPGGAAGAVRPAVPLAVARAGAVRTPRPRAAARRRCADADARRQAPTPTADPERHRPGDRPVIQRSPSPGPPATTAGRGAVSSRIVFCAIAARPRAQADAHAVDALRRPRARRRSAVPADRSARWARTGRGRRAAGPPSPSRRRPSTVTSSSPRTRRGSR